MITECTEADFAVLEDQLGRIPRGVVGIAARSTAGEPLVVATAPRLEDGTPFPTTFYLTHPAYVAECSRLEASGIMAEWTAEIRDDEELAAAYAAALPPAPRAACHRPQAPRRAAGARHMPRPRPPSARWARWAPSYSPTTTSSP